MTSILVIGTNAELARRVQAIPDHKTVVVGREHVDHVTRVDGVASVLGLDLEYMPEIVILGDEVPIGEALSIAQNLDSDFPEIEVVLVAEVDTDLALRAMRVGVREIVPPAITDDELKVLLHRASNNVANRLRPQLDGEAPGTIKDGRVILVASPKGGVGKSTIAANLAVALAAKSPLDTVLVDLDVQFGDAMTLLDLQPTHTIADAFSTSAALDTLILKTFLTVHPAGFYVLCGAESLTVGDNVSAAHVKRLLHQLSAQFRNVVVDTSAGLDEHTLAALEEANDVILVSSMDVASIRSLRKAIDVLSELNLLPSSRHVVLNFADRRSGLAVRDIEAVIGMPVDVVMPRSPEVPIAGNRGAPFMLKQRNSPVMKSMHNLVARLNADLARESQSGKRRKHAGVTT